MLKKEKIKTTLFQKNPYMLYVTNWGFVEQPNLPEQKENQKR